MNSRHYSEDVKKIKALKKLIPIITTILLIAIFTSTASAQVTGTATGSAMVITPIAISKTVDMNFGNIAVSSSLGTVVLAPAGTRTKTGGVTLPAVTGTVTAASFNVTGLGSSTFSITLPTTYTITSGGSTMTVNNFTSTPSSTGTLSSGALTVTVGATLNVAASQAAGTYTNATGFPVVVNYN